MIDLLYETPLCEEGKYEFTILVGTPRSNLTEGGEALMVVER